MILWPVLVGWLITAPAALATSSNWVDPHPLRRDVLLQVRDFTYNDESFLHRFSYRHQQDQPAFEADGLRTTAGSSRSDELYLDFSLKKRLTADNERQQLFFHILREEDFDGRYDRQRVGFIHNLTDEWSMGIIGDVHGDKAESDVHFEGYWNNGHQHWRMALILPDAYFNSKSGDDASFQKKPYTGHLSVRLGDTSASHVRLSINYSPPATLQTTTLEATGNQTRAWLFGRLEGEKIRFEASIKGERTSRSYQFVDPPTDSARVFSRRMHDVVVSARYLESMLVPEAGFRYLRLEEQGLFSTLDGTTGTIRRQEPMLFASIKLDTGIRHSMRPTVYLSHVTAYHDSRVGELSDRDSRKWVGKLSLPWRYTLDKSRGGIITLTPSFRLHRAAFGGGNVQIHWPL